MIERQLFIQYLNTLGTRKAVDWPSRYCCFESSCRPVAHIKSDEHKLLDQAIATVRTQHPHLSNASSPSELRDRDYLVDKKFLEICRRERVITRKWLGIQGWTTAMQIAPLWHCKYSISASPSVSNSRTSSFESTLAWSSLSCTRTWTLKRVSICREQTTTFPKVVYSTKSPSDTSSYPRPTQSRTLGSTMAVVILEMLRAHSGSPCWSSQSLLV
jgi:hypothetical protein